MVLQIEGRLARDKVIEFFVNCEVNNGRITSKVNGVKLSFDDKRLGVILCIPTGDIIIIQSLSGLV